MLRQADRCFFFNPPDAVITEYPEIPVAWNYRELKSMLAAALEAA